jgi:hypothetical protein
MLNNKKTTSVRQYNKLRHKIFLCKDDFNKKIYAGDFVEISASMETRTPWISRVWWTAIDGAFVDSHPAHLQMNLGSGTRDLRYFLQKKYDIPIYNPDDTISETKISHSLRKVTYGDYVNWKKEQDKKDKEWKGRKEKN